MNFDTRTVLDLFILDPDLEIIVSSLVDGERIIWDGTGNKSKNEFVRFVIPVVKDELKFYIKTRLHKMRLGFLKKMIDLDKVDYYHLIPAVCKI